VWRNGVKIAQPTSTSYLDGAVTAGATYSYYITAMDAASNTSGQSNTSSLTVSKGGKP
jgi:fibronectin type 3 domain-containing protein